MTNGEFILQQFQGLGLTEADLLLAGGDIDMGLEYCGMDDIERAMITILEWKILTPSMKSVNENGFSVSWDTSKLLWLYRSLCRKHDVEENPEVLASLGYSSIRDATKKW